MKKIATILIILAVLCALIVPSVPAGAASEQTTIYYGDETLSGSYQVGDFPQVWDLTAGDLTLSYTIDMSQVHQPAVGNTSYTEVGLRQIGGSDFNPGPWDTYQGGEGGWMTSLVGNLTPSPYTQSLMDKHNLSASGGRDERDYDVLDSDPNTVQSPFGTTTNYGIWFDRDGVDQWQAKYWGSVNGGTYNTEGKYNIVITYHALSSTLGTMFATVNGIQTGFYSGSWQNAQPDKYPAGLSFKGDMTQMQVFYGLWAPDATAYGQVQLSNITANGPLVLSAGMATGGGWFIPDANSSGLTLNGSKAIFGFVAKQKDGNSSGQLEFQYQADNLNLKSSSYYWVTISSTQAMFEGEGTLNGVAGYKFRVAAFDGDQAGGQPDNFAIRIWTGNGTYDSPTYKAEGDLGGGQIVVHKK